MHEPSCEEERRLRHSAEANKRARIASGAACSTSSSAAAAPDQDGAASGASALERELERTLRDFVRLRTVSSDPSAAEHCFRGAKFLASLLESLGGCTILTLLFHDHASQICGSYDAHCSRRADC